MTQLPHLAIDNPRGKKRTSKFNHEIVTKLKSDNGKADFPFILNTKLLAS